MPCGAAVRSNASLFPTAFAERTAFQDSPSDGIFLRRVLLRAQRHQGSSSASVCRQSGHHCSPCPAVQMRRTRDKSPRGVVLTWTCTAHARARVCPRDGASRLRAWCASAPRIRQRAHKLVAPTSTFDVLSPMTRSCRSNERSDFAHGRCVHRTLQKAEKRQPGEGGRNGHARMGVPESSRATWVA
jgi:hypothetical protein